MTYNPQWQWARDLIGARPLSTIDATPQMPVGMLVDGIEPYLGFGEFEYVMASANLAIGQVVEFASAADPNGSGAIFATVKPWAGGANSGKTLGVAISAIQNGQFGFVQRSGNAVVTVSGAIAVGNGANWQAAGVVQAAAVASKQMIGVVAATANGANLGTGSSQVALAATQAVYDCDYPTAQGAIT